MNIEITQATLDDKPVLRRMLELLSYELSSFEGTDVNAHGEFGYGYLDHYWREVGRHAFLVRVDGEFAGFAMVNTHHYTPYVAVCPRTAVLPESTCLKFPIERYSLRRKQTFEPNTLTFGFKRKDTR